MTQPTIPAGPHRSAIVQEVLTAVTTGRGAVVAGSPGAGRTTMVDLVARRLPGSRYAVIRTTATETGRPIPFGVFGRLVGTGSAGDPALVADRLRGELGRLSRKRTPILVVEDAHWVDRWSANALLDLAHDGPVRLMVTVRPGAATPDAVVALWKDRHLRRLDLPPLRPDETAELIREELGHEVAAGTAALVHGWTRGNPRLAAELVRHGVATGRLVLDQGLWWWRGPLGVPPRLAELLLPGLDRFTTGQRDALAAVGVAEPLPFEMLERVAPGAVEDLEERGLLRTWDTDRGISVGLGHPLLRAALDARLSAARRRRVAAGHSPGAAADPVTLARWHLAAGAPDTPGVLLDGARRLRPHHPREAARLAGRAVDLDPAGPAPGVLAAARAELGEYREAQAVLHRATVTADDATRRAVLSASLVMLQCVADREPSAAHVDLLALRAVAPPAAHRAVDSAGAVSLLAGGRPADALEVVEGLPRPTLTGRVVRAAALALTGRTAEAGGLADAVAADATGAGRPEVAGLAAAVGALTDLWRTGVATPVATDPGLGRWPARPGTMPGDGVPAVDWPLLAGYGLLLREEDRDAAVHLREALVQQSCGVRPFRSEAAAWLATARAGAGHPDQAQAVLDTAAPDRLAVFPGLRPGAQAAIATARGEAGAAVRLLRRAADEAGAAGAWSVRLWYLARAARLLPADRPDDLAGELERCAGQVDAPVLLALAYGELARLRGDGPGLLDHAGRLAGAGLDRPALRLAEARPVARSATAAALAARLRLALGRPAPVTGAAVLTTRETEMAALAAGGGSNREIADRLVVSVRTVESHLGRVYRKLGVASRQELRASWYAGGAPS
ncbi:LuxR C-terminal-related transcriptional regulator [Actinoplanes sp. NPDC049265]|uniref:helix-turn-helix transcriptional regulator n=1 Tax=Actinoplanes sp. NPDC049265 TaxID=3363902 RepID=UPI003715CE62